MSLCDRFAVLILLISNGLIGSGPVAAQQVASIQDDSFNVAVRPFLKKYCVACHGPKKQNGERRFDQFAGDIKNDDDLLDHQDILDVLNLNEMPPRDARQPMDKERGRVVAWLTHRIKTFHESNQSVRGTVLRRLNAREYRNTIHDLLKIDLTIFNPAELFPRDRTIDHLDTVGDQLVTSGYLLQQYLAAAERSIEKALFPINRPEVQKWSFHDGFRQQPEIDQVHVKTNSFEFMTLYEVVGADKHEGAYGAIRDFAKGVPFDGVYEIRFLAEALNREHPYKTGFFGTDPAESFRLGIVPGDHTAGLLHTPQPIEPLLAEIELDDVKKWYTVRVWLDEGYTPRFTFRNGPIEMRSTYAKLIRTHPDHFPKLKTRGIVETRFTAIKYGKLPQIRIHEFEISGPIHDEWPTLSQRVLFGGDWETVAKSGELSVESARQGLSVFTSRAFRRPAKKEEIDRLVSLFQTRRATGRSAIDAYSDCLKAVLCSPSFLYLDESGERGLTDYALASRLSFFLWGSMPDRELLETAARGVLGTPEVLAAQTNRLLEDDRSEAFLSGFLDSWLTLRELGSTPPDRNAFRDFYQYDLGSAMREETQRFCRHLLDQNLSIVNFLDSDFTVLNKALARHYGIDAPIEEGYELVKLADRRRGGLLGQASILTVTANGIDTSPVVRGVWLLENLLGTPPSPPPPDVEPLDPDTRGAKTIRDQLRRHREVSTCFDCHRKIDPIGFALENFDPIGSWRTRYGRHGAIDASGEMPDGQQFDDIVGFKKILVQHKDQFARTLSTKLLSYATGRQMSAVDRPAIDNVLDQLSERGYGLRDLIHLIVQSDPFRSQ